MKQKRRAMSILCALMLAASMTGCGNSSTEVKSSSEAPSKAVKTDAAEKANKETSAAAAIVTPKGELPIVKDPITLKVAIPVNSKVEDINTNRLTLYIEEQTGIELDIIEMAFGDEASTQVNSIMNGGDLPDVFIGYEFPYDTLCSYADAGLLMPLDDYIEEYGKNLQEVIMADPDLGENVLSYATYDGHVWAMPSGGGLVTNIYTTYQPHLQTSFLEELNMEFPKTLDELRAFLEAVHEAHPEVVPMTSYMNNNYIFSNISQAYQYTDISSYLKVNQGTVSFIANNEKFKAALQYTKEMIDDGLIDPAAFTQDSSVLATQLAQDGDNVAVLACGNMLAGVMDTAGEEYQKMKVIGLLEGPDGYVSAQLNRQAASTRTAMVMTSACRYPEAAFRLFDFFLSDDFAACARIGFEGEQWEKAEEGVLGRDGEQAWFTLLTTQEWVQPSTNVIWDLENFIHSNIMNHCEAAAGLTAYPASEEIITQKIKEADSGEALPMLLMNAEDMAEYNELKSLIVGNVNSNIAQFVLGNRSMEEFDDFCKELEDMGVARYVELAQKAYDTVTK